mmetsp:Transcript_46451/g.112605  ORF Transcript_46451/g.112605 Transcript_46451/m.112605 type:complete len:372 (+) Transcript_46451:279-1394(+)|eukprot:CAMPEP_0113634438 /NCGR_PEP_ID=MMETSP0017_2-20120614/17932_1 /TAXON_ID=2856 /ORGANISM="Cylindrotheca closterium" /LENGTH=371 /DNA_ID=CAMNT_0000545137 /DNA_START=177 /DNA_END=1292 /DNA_ORIENTATION=- /assembly_acc=CAM_ASM_000147
MSFQLRNSFESVGLVPAGGGAAAGAPPPTYYATPTAAPLNTPVAAVQQQQQQQQQPVGGGTTPRHSLHQRLPTNNSSGLESALEALDALDFSSERRGITSDISTLDCESVKADPHFNPAVEETPFVPPLEIDIPVNLEHLVQQQQQQKQQQQPKSKGSGKANTQTRRASFSSSNTKTRRPSDLTRQTSCQSRLEMSQASPHPRSKSLYYHHNNALMKLARNNGGALPPAYAHHCSRGRLPLEQQEHNDQSLEDYANGAGAVTYWDDYGDDDNHSRLSYYTSPTDLYTSSDDSEPVVVVVPSLPSATSTTKKGILKQELKKIMFRFRHYSKSKGRRRSMSKTHKTTLQQSQHHVIEGAIKDYDSFGSERGFC